jgi:hypothetical protein
MTRLMEKRWKAEETGRRRRRRRRRREDVEERGRKWI